jgi:hypothetical protein
MRCSHWLAIVLLCGCARVYAGGPKVCVTAEQAAKTPNKDVCITAHIYEIVELPNGTRFLDVCAPETPDESCHFTIMSLREDRNDVGELLRYRNTDVRLRGVVQSMRGRSGMLLSHARQFYGGPPKFKPNPKLLRGFDAERDRRPVSDPNLRSQGGRRAFMDTHDQTSRPAE